MKFGVCSGILLRMVLFPTDEYYYSGDTLEDLKLIYYSHIDPDETVQIVNTLKQRAQAGRTIFYDIYTDEEKAADTAKEDTGLFFFKGTPGERFAVCNAGGAFAYVGAMQDSFPHALELSGKGYNAFALIYRPGAVVMQYTGLNEYSELDPPTYACVGDRDGIASCRVMQARLDAMRRIGIDTEFHVYSGLGYGFGLGTGTSAEGWLNDAAAFWEKQMDA